MSAKQLMSLASFFPCLLELLCGEDMLNHIQLHNLDLPASSSCSAGLLNSFSSVDHHASPDSSVDPRRVKCIFSEVHLKCEKQNYPQLLLAPLTNNEVDSHCCSYGFFIHHGLYRWSATKVLLLKKIMWTPSVGQHGPLGVHAPPVEKPWYSAKVSFCRPQNYQQLFCVIDRFVLLTYFVGISRPVTRGAFAPPTKFFAPPGKMFWT